MLTVCQTCGDRGFSVALIYCDQCQAYAVHRYCLYKLPKTFEEHVVWFCVDCEPKVAESSTLQPALPETGFQSRLKKGSSIRKSKGKNKIKRLKNKKKSKYDHGLLAVSKVQIQSSPLLRPLENLEKDEMLRGPLRVGGPSSDKEAILTEAKTSPSDTCSYSRGLDWVNIYEGAESVNKRTSHVAINDEGVESVNNRTSHVAFNEHLNITEHNFLDPGWWELDGLYSAEAAECVHTKISPLATSNQIPKHIYVAAQPIFESIWSFHLSVQNLTFGTIAHLSSLACLKVCEMAKCLPWLLHLELLPRCDVWPKGFNKWGPSDETIALYFFPSNERDVKIFDSLIDKMIGQDLGMRTVVQDVDLLVYTSFLLPLHFWRFQEKFYLWGVFRAKQAAHLTNVVRGEGKNFAKAKTWDSRSPVSPLSDNGSSLSCYGNS